MTQPTEIQNEFNIQKIYTKDLSYESPGTPDTFQIEWTPKIDFDLQINSKKIMENVFEVILQITVTTKTKDKVAFLIEIKQAGIFTLKNFPDDQLALMLGSYCPNILFPYAREVISETVNRGGFPPLYLSPINFDALYHEHNSKANKGN
ncbi:MAG: hypothetical protein ACD_26C00066G0002 [uncultured bacterium]|nr:MAG: hypothetical protein ACD_26C00066G0002 [uncultured bacterium]